MAVIRRNNSGNFLSKANIIVGILVALTGAAVAIGQFWHDTAFDNGCEEALRSAQDYIIKGRECTKTLIETANIGWEVSQSEIKLCYGQEKRGLNKLEEILSEDKCPRRIRKEALREMILFYESSMEPERFASTIDSLHSLLGSLSRNDNH